MGDEALKRLLVPPFEGPWFAVASEPDDGVAARKRWLSRLARALIRCGLDTEFTPAMSPPPT